MTKYSPSELILARTEAFRHADYGFIFDSYHSGSAFRQQFSNRDEYIRFGWANLGKKFHILQCRILKQDLASRESRVIFFMEMDVSGQRQAYVELTWMQREDGNWRYHRGQKIEENELPCPLDQLDFDTFDRIEQKAIF
ncbi:MAG: hypothetical protein KAT93_03170 [Desulfuromonadales bacterium]|nr:hypothetical protein [Desulfuromonadales bacterium]